MTLLRMENGKWMDQLRLGYVNEKMCVMLLVMLRAEMLVPRHK